MPNRNVASGTEAIKGKTLTQAERWVGVTHQS